MTILPPPTKKKRERDGTQKAIGQSASNSDHRQSSNSSQSGVGRKIRQSPRPSEKCIKRNLLVSPSSSSSIKLPSPLASPRSVKTGDENANASPSGENANNSDDEYQMEDHISDDIEKEFREKLSSRGLIIKEMQGDGACMFRAIAEQIYGDEEMHGEIRKLCMDYMMNNRDYFRDFITEDFDHYILRKRDATVHGNHAELQAISEMFARPVEVYQYSEEPISVLLPRNNEHQQGSSSTALQQNAPLRLSYHGAVHYNAIVDPHAATIGVGLGLPGMVPGEAERNLMSNAIETSERDQIEETMLKDKIDMTDWQRTQADMEDQIIRESYLSFLKETEDKGSSVDADEKKPEEAPSTSEVKNSLDEKPTPETLVENEPEPPKEKPGLYEELLAAQTLGDWEAYNEDVAMAEALVLSQQTYMASQSSNNGPSSSRAEH